MPTDAIRVIYGAAQAAVSPARGSSCLGVWTDAPNRKSVGLATPPNRADTCRLRATVGLAPSLSSLGLHAQLLSLAVRTASDKSWASWASLSLGTRLFAHGRIFCRARIVWYRQRHLQLWGQASGVAYARCRRQCIEARSADQSAEARKKIFAFFFSYQEGLSWHLRALYCAFQMYEDLCCARSATRFAYITRLAESA